MLSGYEIHCFLSCPIWVPIHWLSSAINKILASLIISFITHSIKKFYKVNKVARSNAVEDCENGWSIKLANFLHQRSWLLCLHNRSSAIDSLHLVDVLGLCGGGWPIYHLSVQDYQDIQCLCPAHTHSTRHATTTTTATMRLCAWAR